MADYTDRFSPEARKAWDDTFANDGRRDESLPATPGRLAQRARLDFEETDKMGYAQQILDRQRTALNEELTFNKGARDLFKIKQDLDFRERKAQADWQRNNMLDAKKIELQNHQIARADAMAEADAARKLKLEKEATRAAKIEAAADQFKAKLADAPFGLEPDQMDEWVDASARQFQGASDHPQYAEEIKAARTRIKARQTEQAKADAAAASAKTAEGLGMVPKSVSSAGVTYGTPPDESGELTPQQKLLKDEASRLDREYYTEVRSWNAAKKANQDAVPSNEARVNELRAKREEIGMKLYGDNAQPAAAASTGDARTELAKKALSDPKASEAHKAAARKILGQ